MLGSVARTLADKIRGTNMPGTVPGFLRPIDTAAIAKQFDLDAIASRRGSEDQPSTDSSSLDAVEQQIVQKLESEWNWQGGELINNLRA